LDNNYDRKGVLALHVPGGGDMKFVHGQDALKSYKRVFSTTSALSFHDFYIQMQIASLDDFKFHRQHASVPTEYTDAQPGKHFVFGSILEHKENDKYEFKLTKISEATTYLTGFLNAAGGSLYSGVSNNGEIIGKDLFSTPKARLMGSLAKAVENCHPTFKFDVVYLLTNRRAIWEGEWI
jgi:hypothetical protein